MMIFLFLLKTVKKSYIKQNSIIEWLNLSELVLNRRGKGVDDDGNFDAIIIQFSGTGTSLCPFCDHITSVVVYYKMYLLE